MAIIAIIIETIRMKSGLRDFLTGCCGISLFGFGKRFSSIGVVAELETTGVGDAAGFC